MAHRSFLGSVGMIFGDVARARQAYSAYERLSHMSDASLAKKGLKRSDISRVALGDVLNEE